MNLLEIKNSTEKKRILRTVLEALPEWFEMKSGRESYIKECETQLCFAAVEKEKPVGFICLKETGKDTLELAVMGILKEYHRRGIGKQLFVQAKQRAMELGYSFIQVKTVKMGIYPSYDKTNLFYKSLGFKEFEIFPTLWDENNPCQIYVMNLC